MTTTQRLAVLTLFLTLQACSGGGREAGGGKPDAGDFPTGIFILGDAGSSGSTDSAAGISRNDAAVDPLKPVEPDGGLDAEVVADLDAATPDASFDVDAGHDAGHDAGQDAGPPLMLGGICDPCTVDADCEANNCLDRLGESVCLPPRIGMDYQCTAYPGNAWLYATGTWCVPYDKVMFKHLTCAEWHTLTGL